MITCADAKHSASLEMSTYGLLSGILTDWMRPPHTTLTVELNYLRTGSAKVLPLTYIYFCRSRKTVKNGSW